MIRINMKTFEDLIFNIHPLGQGMQAKITLDNGKKLSVLFGELFYSDGVSTYEAMELGADSEPRGYLTKEEVNEYIKELQKASAINEQFEIIPADESLKETALQVIKIAKQTRKINRRK